ncbi:glycosyltransferase [Lysinibacillus fusiformis]|uniref:glycosyltransferase n=1 Tax=Lysinibacillus fusiformis TaxID=28031 RepID=UPI0035577DBF
MRTISVLMTVYNGEKYVIDAIQSILNQTFQDFELIIVDDGSTDQTVNLIRGISDERISLHTLPRNMGVGYANNYAVQFAVGKYLAKMDADDISYPERLATQFEFLEKNAQVGIVDSFVNFFTESKIVEKSQRYKDYKEIYSSHINKYYDYKTLQKELFWYCNIVHSAVMYRRELTKFFNYPLDMKICEDYSFFYRMNQKGIIFHKIPSFLLSVRLSENSITATKTEEMLKNVFKIKKNDISTFIRENEKPIAIWGASNLGKLTCNYIRNNFNVQPIVFIDSNIKKEDGRQLQNINIVNPNEIEFHEYKFFVASSYGKFQIAEQLEQKGLKNIKDYFVVF